MIKQAIKRRHPGFNERAYGFRSFNDLLADAQKRGLLTLRADEKSGGYTVRVAERPAPAQALNLTPTALTLVGSMGSHDGLEIMNAPRRKSWMWAEACALLDEAERRHRHFYELLSAPSAAPVWEPPANIFARGAEVHVMVALPGARGRGRGRARSRRRAC